MKHVFSTMVSAMILAAASVIPAMASEMPAPYRELVKEVQDEFAGGCPRYQAWYSGNCEANENSLESVFADNEHFENRDPYGFGYVLKDLDGNGVDELGYLYFAERTRLRITKDAQVTCRADDGSERITTMSAEEFFRTYAGNFLMCMDVEAYNEAGYATKLYSYTAG